MSMVTIGLAKIFWQMALKFAWPKGLVNARSSAWLSVHLIRDLRLPWIELDAKVCRQFAKV